MMNVRALAASLGFLFGVATQSLAGDAAELHVMGFTPDGKVFGFEEFGIQDGSGFPYSYRYYIDVATDAFLPGTPVRALLEQDGASLIDARKQAETEAMKIIPDSALQRSYLAAFNAVTEESADPYNLLANPRPVFPPIDPPVAFKLEETNLPAPEGCKDLGEIKGFRLIRTQPAGASATIHDDKSIPESRGCPQGYRLAGLQTFYPDGGADPVFAVLITVIGYGFEGPNHRWIAVTGKL